MAQARFIDRAKVYVRSGKGGDGCTSFRREKFVPFGGPDGGDGGRGGHVIIQADDQVDSLQALYYRPHQHAEDGVNGRGQQRSGRNGKDLIITVPCGTEVRNEEGGLVCEVLQHGECKQIAKGGNGGKGNQHFASPTNQVPQKSIPGEEEETFVFWFELKLVADAGLVGYPNAGKSTLLTRISHAHPRIAAYPFTTLNPIIGTVEYGYQSLRVADIPGLIDGAHAGTGLGHDFLRHIERTRLLVFIIDLAGVDGRNPTQDYFNLRKELRLYRPDLDSRDYIVVANKIDLPEAKDRLEDFRQETGESVLAISAEEAIGIEEVKQLLAERLLN